MTKSKQLVYRCRETIRWLKDSNQIVLIDEAISKSFILRDVEASLWTWLSLSYPYPTLLRMLETLLVQSSEEAESWLRITLDKWYQQGILDKEDSTREY